MDYWGSLCVVFVIILLVILLVKICIKISRKSNNNNNEEAEERAVEEFPVYVIENSCYIQVPNGMTNDNGPSNLKLVPPPYFTLYDASPLPSEPPPAYCSVLQESANH